jgi:hypothetical protein
MKTYIIFSARQKKHNYVMVNEKKNVIFLPICLLCVWIMNEFIF